MAKTTLDPSSTIRKILVVHLRPLGDVLLTSAYLPALRQRFPDAHIDFLVYKPWDRLLYKNPYLSNILAAEKGRGASYLFHRLKLFALVFSRRYDLIIDSNNTTTSAQIVAFSGARYRLGNEQGKGRPFYNLLAKDGTERYNAAKRFDTLKPLGISEGPIDLRFYISEDAKNFIHNWIEQQGLQDRDIGLFSPGASFWSKAWKSEYFAEFANTIAQRTDLVPVIIWGPGEESYVQAMTDAMTTNAYVLPPTTIDQAAAMLQVSRFLFCNDGGLNHLAVATKTPTLTFFGVISPQSWSAQDYVPTHFHMFNPHWDWRQDDPRNHGYTPVEAFQRFKSIAGKFGIDVYE